MRERRPRPVTAKRFLAPLWLFIFGTAVSLLAIPERELYRAGRRSRYAGRFVRGAAGGAGVAARAGAGAGAGVGAVAGSGRASSRPRKRTVTLSLSPSSRNFEADLIFVSISCSSIFGVIRISFHVTERCFFLASLTFCCSE